MRANVSTTSVHVEEGLDRLLGRRASERAVSAELASEPSSAEVQKALAEVISERVGSGATVTAVKKLAGGGANRSYRFTLTDGEVAEQLVLRVKVPGACCPTDAQREFEMMRAVQGVLPTPTPRWLLPDGGPFGADALIMSHEKGVAAPTGAAPLATGLGTVYGERLRPRLAEQFVRHVARLHSAVPPAGALNSFDIPQPGTTEAIDWRLAFWDRVWQEDALEPHPLMILCSEWLWDNRPVVDHVSLLHGDYRNGNFLFDEATAEIQSVIDWELCWIGDRHSDLAYAMMPAWGFRDSKGTFYNSGLVDTETLITQYEALSGLPVDRDRLRYYLVFNLYWSVIALIGTGPRNARDGRTRLDVMYNFIAGLGGYFNGELVKLILGD
jgi:aminoglycoside phosphotransferase (APT) family kinase protein